MKNIGRDNDHGATLDNFAGELVAINGNAADRGNRRIKSDRFFDRRARFDKAINRFGGGVPTLPPVLDACRPFWRLAE